MRKKNTSPKTVSVSALADEVQDPLRPLALKEFNKANESINVRVQQGRLTLLSRKIFNVLVYHAQQAGVPGKDAPVRVKNADRYFWIPMREIAVDASYGSNDTELFKQYVDELQDVRVYHEGEGSWTSERLLASVRLVKVGRGGSHSANTVMLGYMFPPEVENMVLKPNQYTKLSLYYQAQFRRVSSLTLYEVCKRYATNPSRLTAKQPWGWWHNLLSGNNTLDNEPPTEYKYFKRDVLLPSIKEINISSDVSVDLIEHRHGRKINELQFTIRPSSQTALPFGMEPVIDSSLLERMKSVGVSHKDAVDLLALYSVGQIDEALLFTQKRLRNTSLAPLGSTAAYFKRALKGGYAQPALTESKKTKAVKEGVANSLDHAHRQAMPLIAPEAQMSFDALELHEQRIVLNDFCQTVEYQRLPLSAKRSIDAGKLSPMANSALMIWLSEKAEENLDTQKEE